jgi:hypothetical protein
MTALHNRAPYCSSFKLQIIGISALVGFCCGYGSLSPTAGGSSGFKVERGQLSSIFTAAFLMSSERLGLSSSITTSNPSTSFTSPVFNLAFLREVDRLRDNFTKDPTVHQIIVAKDDANEIIGYTDLDRRNPTDRRYPTPYISGKYISGLVRR